MRRILSIVLGLVVLSCAGRAGAASVLIEAESFSSPGGWSVDQQFMDQMGSPYLLAHGLGRPVADASTKAHFATGGTYRIFVRTMDWVARWKAPGAPGRFQVLVNGKALEPTFGAEGAAWHWQEGGAVRVEAGDVALALHDQTGFEGRCDAILFSDDPSFTPSNDPAQLAAFRRKALGLPDRPEDGGNYDLVVVGGGMAGSCAAIAAARLDCRVALIQDRPVLGGNNSSEVRVWLGGQINLPPYPQLGNIVDELDPRSKSSPGSTAEFNDSKKLDVVKREKNITLHLNWHVVRVEMEQGKIAAVVARHVLDGREMRFAGRLFADCTGDGEVGTMAGADADITPTGHMGASNMWRVADAGRDEPFPRCPWAVNFSGKPLPTKLADLGKWMWEGGFDLDPIADMERVRDQNLRAMYGAWDCLKNDKKLYPTHQLEWAAFIAGKRESRRLLGDVILTKEDVLSQKVYPDACVTATWSIDLHRPDPRYAASFSKGDESLSVADFTKKQPYAVPYRCFYSRNLPNLFMAGRDVSVTHEALGTVRVMRTGGMMGEVVGRAAALCKKRDVLPRDVYASYWEQMKELLSNPLKPAR